MEKKLSIPVLFHFKLKLKQNFYFFLSFPLERQLITQLINSPTIFFCLWMRVETHPKLFKLN